MTEQLLQTRIEHSRSLNDAEKYRALDVLKELGLLIPVADIDVYHGRVATVEETSEWVIDPSFANGGNDSGNRNVNVRPTLYTSDYYTATDFAAARASHIKAKNNQKSLKEEVHKIVSADSDAVVIDFGFDAARLDEVAKAEYYQALKTLAISATEGSPVCFEDRHAVNLFASELQKINPTKSVLSQEDIDHIVSSSGGAIRPHVALQLASAYNARQLTFTSPAFLTREMIKNSEGIITSRIRQDQYVPLNIEYIQRMLRLAHVVGVKQGVTSATLNRPVMCYSFFDLEKVDTQTSLERRKEAVSAKLGSIAAALGLDTAPVQKNKLGALLTDVYVKPEKLIKATKEIDGFAEILEADAGNWEGFTLEEHVETVLRNFDENFADRVPVQLLAPMRLAIIAHDLGKPIAAKRQDKHNQKKYNIDMASKFYDAIGVDERLKSLLLKIVGEGTELAYRSNVRGEQEAVDKLEHLAKFAMQTYLGKIDVSKADTAGFVEMCHMLHICDGGAYTSMAITRSTRLPGRFRNAPSFNGSFRQPVGFGSRDIKLRTSKDQLSAESDLTPKFSQR